MSSAAACRMQSVNIVEKHKCLVYPYEYYLGQDLELGRILYTAHSHMQLSTDAEVILDVYRPAKKCIPVPCLGSFQSIGG